MYKTLVLQEFFNYFTGRPCGLLDQNCLFLPQQ